MKRRRLLAVAGWLCAGGLASAQAPQTMNAPPGAVKPNPAKATGVVPITEFMAPPEFPFAPKPKPSLLRRTWNQLIKPFKSSETEALPPGVVPQPGVLPTQGYQTPPKK